MFGFSIIQDRVQETLEKRAYNEGYKVGMEVGIRKGMTMNFEKSRELTQSEYDEVIKFLVERGLELCCYDINRGGFSVRKSYNFLKK